MLVREEIMSYIQNVRSLRLKRSRVLVVRTRRLLEDDLWTRRLISAAVANEILPSQLDIWRYPEMVHLLSRSESEDGADVYIRAAMLRLDSRTPPPNWRVAQKDRLSHMFQRHLPPNLPPPPKKNKDMLLSVCVVTCSGPCLLHSEFEGLRHLQF